MYYIYILYSKSSEKFYVGYTGNIEKRVNEHNNSERNTYTSKHRPWVLAAAFECGEVEAEAIKIEKFIKKQKSRSLLEKLINGNEFNEILAQLVRVPNVRD